ncbi:transglutaminase domain-containing protein [Patescibacteria group bacterium]|nr:transglutaminase domain-containing protein [Patescibacteria group bacterium]
MEILQDRYVYNGKACSDLTIVFLALCKAAGISGRLVKLNSIDGKFTHSIAEVNLNGVWHRFDVSSKDSIPVEGELTNESIWNKKYKVYKKGKDVWDLGLDSAEFEVKIYK